MSEFKLHVAGIKPVPMSIPMADACLLLAAEPDLSSDRIRRTYEAFESLA